MKEDFVKSSPTKHAIGPSENEERMLSWNSLTTSLYLHNLNTELRKCKSQNELDDSFLVLVNSNSF